MLRFGPTTRTELIRGLRQLGFRGPYSGGKHQFMVKEHLRVRIPHPHRSDIGQNLLRAMLREAGISVAGQSQARFSPHPFSIEHMERSVRALLPVVTTMTERLPEVMATTEGNIAGSIGAR